MAPMKGEWLLIIVITLIFGFLLELAGKPTWEMFLIGFILWWQWGIDNKEEKVDEEED